MFKLLTRNIVKILNYILRRRLVVKKPNKIYKFKIKKKKEKHVHVVSNLIPYA
jgi:hypothetical protein